MSSTIDKGFYTLQFAIGTDPLDLTGLYAADPNLAEHQILLKQGPDFDTESVKNSIGFIAYYTTYSLSTTVVYISSNRQRQHLPDHQIRPGTTYTWFCARRQLR